MCRSVDVSIHMNTNTCSITILLCVLFAIEFRSITYCIYVYLLWYLFSSCLWFYLDPLELMKALQIRMTEQYEPIYRAGNFLRVSSWGYMDVIGMCAWLFFFQRTDISWVSSSCGFTNKLERLEGPLYTLRGGIKTENALPVSIYFLSKIGNS